ncbi:MAG: LysR substrate-binding domain-containing protein, partial [Rhizobiaceae bacterium]|nr:LysR substrate-binding domain-containing protein [Rhizobiaceae bacterium]
IKPRFQSSSIFAQLTATRNGLGLCVLPIFIAKNYPELEVVLEDEVELLRHYWITCHRDLRQVGRVRSVIEFLRNIVRENMDAFLGTRVEKPDGAGSVSAAEALA